MAKLQIKSEKLSSFGGYFSGRGATIWNIFRIFTSSIKQKDYV